MVAAPKDTVPPVFEEPSNLASDAMTVSILKILPV